MSSLLQLPREIRDEIWASTIKETLLSDASWSSYGYFGLGKGKDGTGPSKKRSGQMAILRTCRQILYELTPFFYAKVCVTMVHTNQTLRWLQTIGPRNSACIRHLVIQYCSLLLNYNDEPFLAERTPAWREALRCMPNLLTLTFDLEQDHIVAPLRNASEEDILDNDTLLLKELANSASAWSKSLWPIRNLSRRAAFQYRPIRSQLDQINHAVFAIDEDLPRPLVKYFANLLQLSSATSLDLPITGLPRTFIREQGLEPACTYAFNDKTEKASVVLSYRRISEQPITPDAVSSNLNIILQGVPLCYLRIGCRHIDSKVIVNLPSISEELVTLDVAFTDSDPGNVADCLATVQASCPKLFTLAIDVSPLHDRDPDSEWPEEYFDRKFVGQKEKEQWQPFWTRLDEMVAAGIRVWEGETPGFRRARIKRTN